MGLKNKPLIFLTFVIIICLFFSGCTTDDNNSDNNNDDNANYNDNLVLIYRVLHIKVYIYLSLLHDSLHSSHFAESCLTISGCQSAIF